MSNASDCVSPGIVPMSVLPPAAVQTKACRPPAEVKALPAATPDPLSALAAPPSGSMSVKWPSQKKGWFELEPEGQESPTTRPQLSTPKALLCEPPSVPRSVTV